MERERPETPDHEANGGQPLDPVFCVRVCGTPDFELQHEICQPDDSVDHFPVSVRRNVGVVRLGGWGAGTRRLAALEVAAAHHAEHPIMVVDEIERGLEPYRQRILVEDLLASPVDDAARYFSYIGLSSAFGKP
ncbi:hypothetical protein LB526_02010 [Mesorhizobium sp. CA6]|uniref:hypothetical protein n=1 Tax=Mesorhizobium sp. CA6 TaxID=588500 RepID=UPI001CCDD982|nr:hypothetical protein [Mesorhizobium sp. CA6]MBZ9765534.1 hypothetical protein [Mesorhizobium sp. CA6]